MTNETCEHENPAVPGMLCDKPPHPFGAHMHREPLTVWPGLAMPQRGQRGPRGERAREVTRRIEQSGRASRTGAPQVGSAPPKEAEESWRETQEKWLVQATAALREVCEQMEEFTNEAVWARVDNIREKRAMVLVVRHGLRAGWMHEDHAVRIKGTWRTRDGVEFPLNKLVPVYRSDLHLS